MVPPKKIYSASQESWRSSTGEQRGRGQGAGASRPPSFGKMANAEMRTTRECISICVDMEICICVLMYPARGLFLTKSSEVISFHPRILDGPTQENLQCQSRILEVFYRGAEGQGAGGRGFETSELRKNGKCGDEDDSIMRLKNPGSVPKNHQTIRKIVNLQQSQEQQRPDLQQILF